MIQKSSAQKNPRKIREESERKLGFYLGKVVYFKYVLGELILHLVIENVHQK